PPAGSRPAGPLIADAAAPDRLVARYRAPAARLASDVRSRRACAARTIPRSLRGRSGLLFPVLAVGHECNGCLGDDRVDRLEDPARDAPDLAGRTEAGFARKPRRPRDGE